MITAQDVDTIYDVPLTFHDQGLDELIIASLQLSDAASAGDLSAGASWFDDSRTVGGKLPSRS